MFCYSHLISKGTEQYSQFRKLSCEWQDINCKKTHFTVWTGWAYGICVPLTTWCLPYFWLLEMFFMSWCPTRLPLFRLSKNKHDKITLKNRYGGHMLIRNVTSTFHHLYHSGKSGKTRVPEMKQVKGAPDTGAEALCVEIHWAPIWFLCLWIFYPNTHLPSAYWQGCANPAVGQSSSHGIGRVQTMTAQTREILAGCKKDVYF